jgi:DNA replication protein DnaC
MSQTELAVKLLSQFKLNGMAESVGAITAEANKEKLSHLGFLNRLLDYEIEFRKEKRLKRNMTGAHLPVIKELNDFNFSCISGITEQDSIDLLDFNWIDRTENLLFFGPPGVGKTHLSIALGMQALRAGYTVCFERITSLIKLLKTAEIQQSSRFRINRILKSSVLIIDEIGYTSIDKKEANMLFTLISELYERSSIIITSNQGIDRWAEMLGDEVMTTAMVDRLLHHAHVFNLSGDSYRVSSKNK